MEIVSLKTTLQSHCWGLNYLSEKCINKLVTTRAVCPRTPSIKAELERQSQRDVTLLERAGSRCPPPLAEDSFFLLMSKNSFLFLPPEYFTGAPTPMTTLTHPPNIKQSHDDPAAEGGINTALRRGKRDDMSTAGAPSEPDPSCSPTPGFSVCGQCQQLQLGARRPGEKALGEPGCCRARSAGHSSGGLYEQRAPAPFVPPLQRRPPGPGGSAPRHSALGPAAGDSQKLLAPLGPAPRRAPSRSPRAEPSPGRGQRQGLCPSADPAPDAPA